MNERAILAIETSCDETAVSVVAVRERSVNILSHEVYTQQEHGQFGGVVPEIASRDHLLKLPDVFQQALIKSGINKSDIDAVAVTLGPGLVGALMVGILFARGLARGLNRPLIGVNHVDAHLAPSLFCHEFILQKWQEHPIIEFPALALTVSGGHCILSYLTSATHRKILGKTADDACGEAFDKVAKLLKLPYPGGPLIQDYAHKVDSQFHDLTFPSTIQNPQNRYGFSYSGLKTAVLNEVQKNRFPIEHIAFAFQKAAINQLLDRMKNALHDYPEIKSILVAGGVAANQYLREQLVQLQHPCFVAPLKLCGDNATMIAMHAAFAPVDGFENHVFPRYPYEI